MRVQCPGCDAPLRIPAADEGQKVECPECGKVFRARADEAADEAPRKKGRKKAAGPSNAQTFQIAGGTVVAVLAVGAVVWVIASRPKAEAPAAAKPDPDRGVAVLPKNADPRLVNNPGDPAGGGGFGEEAALGDLFRRPVPDPPPLVRLAGLERKPGEPPPDVPAFPSLRPAGPKGTSPAPKDAGLTLDEVEKATVYIVVKGGSPNRPGSTGNTGSGFLIGSAGGGGLVATNHHVIEAALARPTPGSPAPSITVVFNSGAAGERAVPATVTAIDPVADLAVLRVPGGQLPKPIDPWAGPPPVKTMDVRICGFPLGKDLAGEGNVHPAISVSKGSVSSLRADKGGKLEKVQITGPLIPGNSGGPIVDNDGRLVGVAVTTLRGTGIGFAVPAADLVALVEGRLRAAAVVPTGLDGTTATFRVAVPVVDPFGRVKAVRLRYWAGSGPRPKAVKGGPGGHEPMKPAEQLALAVGEGPAALPVAAGELRLPADAAEVVLQVVAEVVTDAGTRLTVASPPAAFAVAVADQPSGRDAQPFAALAGATTPGEVVVVRGRVLSPPKGRAPVLDLAVAGLDGNKPPGLRFVTTREVAAQFDELDAEHEGLDARLACVVGTRGPDGLVPVRVARVDLLAEGDRVVRSIPAADPGDGLAALNRDPAKFAGRTLELTVSAVPLVRPPGIEDYFLVLFPNRLHLPRNLVFVTTPGLTDRLDELEQSETGIVKVRLSVSVGGQVTGDPPTVVTIRKIEFLNPKDGSVTKTIE